MFVDFHDGCLITAPVAVIWGREYGHYVSILRPIITLHNQLMSSCNQSQAIIVVESLGNVLAKRIPSSSRRYSPPASIIWIRPQEIAHRTLVWYLLYAVEGSDIIECINAGRETSVEAEDLVINQGCEGKVVEEVGEVFPDIRVAVLSEALVVEAIDLGNLAGFVITTEDCDALGISDLEGHEEGDSFDGVVSSINIVAHEEIIGIWIWATNSE